MELSSEVFLWLEPTIAKRAALQSSADPIRALVDTLEAVRLAKYLIVAVFTFLLHDIVATYAREVQLIWGSRWTFVRVLYTITRYFAPCVLLVNLAFTFHPNLSAEVQGGNTADGRARDFLQHGRNDHTFATGLGAMGPEAADVGCAVVSLCRFSITPNYIGREYDPVPGILTGCVVTSSSSTSTHWVTLYIASLTYESTLFLLTLARAWSLNRRGVGTPIIVLLTRDGAWYFVVVIASVALTALGTSIPKTQAAALLSQFFIAVMSCTCCRLLLRLRGFYTPTDQSSGNERTSADHGVSLQLFNSKQSNRGVLPPSSTNTSFVHHGSSSKLQV